jgi:hypothetical protein
MATDMRQQIPHPPHAGADGPWARARTGLAGGDEATAGAARTIPPSLCPEAGHSSERTATDMTTDTKTQARTQITLEQTGHGQGLGARGWLAGGDESNSGCLGGHTSSLASRSQPIH